MCFSRPAACFVPDSLDSLAYRGQKSHLGPIIHVPVVAIHSYTYCQFSVGRCGLYRRLFGDLRNPLRITCGSQQIELPYHLPHSLPSILLLGRFIGLA